MNLNRLDYKILVVGLGSMGKRRIRNLKEIGIKNVFGFDTRKDRADETSGLHGVKLIQDLEKEIKENKFDAMIISVPPDVHHVYMNLAVEHNIHFFVEASVVDYGLSEIIDKLKNRNIVAAPSATLYFHPAIRHIYSIVESGALGTVSNFVYHSGQYLPDWHTYEKVSEFYVSKKETGGAREIVPFELTWITKLLGFPNMVSGIVKKTVKIDGAESIDDTYNALLSYDGLILNIVIDVVSRYATRRLLINGSEKQLLWSWDDTMIRIYDPRTEEWSSVEYQLNSSATGYNKNITEQMYIDELLNFFNAIEGKVEFFNTLEYDHKVLKLLYTIEKSSFEKAFQFFN